jgi:hypothetical protein
MIIMMITVLRGKFFFFNVDWYFVGSYWQTRTLLLCCCRQQAEHFDQSHSQASQSEHRLKELVSQLYSLLNTGDDAFDFTTSSTTSIDRIVKRVGWVGYPTELLALPSC